MKVCGSTYVKCTITLTLEEDEARALSAIACYGFDVFTKAFYQHIGDTYLKPHEIGLRSLFDGMVGVNSELAKCSDAKVALSKGSKGKV